MAEEIIRFCGNCGKDMPIIVLDKVDTYKNFAVHQACCIKGHSFSTTGIGLNIVLVPNGGSE